MAVVLQYTILLGIILPIDDHEALNVHILLQYTKLGLANFNAR